MSYDNDRIQFYTTLNTLWGSTTPIRFDTIQDNDQISKGSVPWIHCNIDPYETDQGNLGSTNILHRTQGIFTIDIYDRTNNGFAQILKYADTIKTAFVSSYLSDNSIRVGKVSILSRESYEGWSSKRVQINYVSNEYVQRV